MRLSPIRLDRCGRAFVVLAAADDVPDGGDQQPEDEDDGGIVHGRHADGEG